MNDKQATESLRDKCITLLAHARIANHGGKQEEGQRLVEEAVALLESNNLLGDAAEIIQGAGMIERAVGLSAEIRATELYPKALNDYKCKGESGTLSHKEDVRDYNI